MTYGVLTILLGLVIFLATKLTPKNLKGSAQGEEISQDSKKKSAQQQNKVETPENLAQWVLSMEKAKSDLKEKLCSPPVFSGSKILFGRESVLIELFNAINKGKLLIELYGRQGAGKTSLALEVERKYKFNFQNIKLYLDLGGEDGLSTKDAMIQVVLSFRPTVRIPENFTQLKKLYRNMMAKRQGVLLLDNVASIDQVKELKPTGTCSWLMIVTAETKLGLDEALSIEVEPLEVESAQEFLVDCSLRLKPRAREIAKLCRGLPLALELCGFFLSSKMKVDLEDFVNLFRKHRNNSLLERSDEYEESLQAAFKAIYFSLNDKEQAIFNQLAVFPSSFESLASSQVCEENGNGLKSFANYGLVKMDPVTKRYFLHNWVKNQLKNYLPATIAREAKLRHAAYYLPALDTAQKKILKGGDAAREGFQLFHREWSNIKAGLNQVRKNSVEGKKAADLFNSYMIAGAELLPLHYFPKDCRSFLEAGLKVSQRLNKKDLEALNLLNLGAFHNSQNKYDVAEECLKQADQLATTLENPQIRGQIFNEMARLYLAKNMTEESINILLKKKKLCQEHKVEVDEEISALRLGLAYEQKGEFDKAILVLKEGKRKAKEAGNSSCMGALLRHLGFCLGEVNDITNAEDYFEASLLLARGLGKRKEELDILLRCGEIYVKSKDFEQALNLLKEGLELAENYHDKRHEGLFFIKIGDTYSLMQEKQNAMENYMKALGPLKKAKEMILVDEINRKLNHSFELTEENEGSTESKKVIRPIQKPSRGKGLGLVQSKTNEFIQRGDNNMISYYIGSIEEIFKTYQLDVNETTTRESLLGLLGTLRENNYHSCATILKNKFSL
ncbi:MAG: tetratricopeptide repeat protein [Nitrospina sp.]|jgi:tetratricopeptide (TPR) repeat protein|nr:tetratricopeptide repeat protein [Nitrospina sp.]MBT3508531.1 tetratricopeptide repeat protein [Nitrospina sp.]MBT3875307.1 tetratricopeptide repeat protein [Nitrospina sp.]MBT4048608.1 tetratricopeptide repeat protein [Nitrospina sp.]MBT4559036.1 tetratricopeptide repeat protein [Nitrospina sp.]